MYLLSRFGAACGVLLGLSVAVPGLVEAFTGETTATSLVLGLGATLGVPAATSLYLHHSDRAGRFGAVAYVLNAVGLGLFGAVAFTLNVVLFQLDDGTVARLREGPAGATLQGAGIVFVVGTVAFAASMVRAGAFSRVPAIGYGIFVTSLAVLARLDDTPLSSAVHVAAGAALVWLSATAWTARTGAGGARQVAPDGGQPAADRASSGQSTLC